MSENTRSAGNQQERFLAQLEPNYVVGLVGGEGYFSIHANRRKQKTWILNEVHFVFGIKLRADDGEIVLKTLQTFFDCGFVYFRKDTRKNFSNCYEFQVNTHREIFNVIIPFFRKYPPRFPSKLKAFEQFCSIAEMVQKREHLKSGGVEKIKQLSAAMH